MLLFSCVPWPSIRLPTALAVALSTVESLRNLSNIVVGRLVCCCRHILDVRVVYMASDVCQVRTISLILVCIRYMKKWTVDIEINAESGNGWFKLGWSIESEIRRRLTKYFRDKYTMEMVYDSRYGNNLVLSCWAVVASIVVHSVPIQGVRWLQIELRDASQSVKPRLNLVSVEKHVGAFLLIFRSNDRTFHAKRATI